MRTAIRSLALLVVCSLPTFADGNAVTIAFNKDSYAPAEMIELIVTGAPGTTGFLFFDTAAGPTVIPGIGTVDLGLSANLDWAPFGPIPGEGELMLCCDLECDSPFLGVPIYFQALTADAFGVCLSNSDTLLVEDPTGSCFLDGCTPGYWKNHLSEWANTEYSPTDDFDTVFGVDAFDPDITLEDAVSSPGSLYKNLHFHAVAAILNASSDSVNYGLTTAEIIAHVQAAFASGDPDQWEAAKDLLAGLNEIGCPL